MEQLWDAYLDIETTGLCAFYDEITVIGICLANGSEHNLIQLVGSDVTRPNLLRTLRLVGTIYTYNGSGFDLPFINCRLGVDLKEHFHHHDLMHDCWRNNLYGGFKAVERQLGIPRRLQGINGAEAVILWWRYQTHHDQKALDLLLEYNKEDVVNLVALKRKLERFRSRSQAPKAF
ncbi:MAG: ribonuclease H-like domain-containing protein [Dehalococcoidia bacterium]